MMSSRNASTTSHKIHGLFVLAMLSVLLFVCVGVIVREAMEPPSAPAVVEGQPND